MTKEDTFGKLLAAQALPEYTTPADPNVQAVQRKLAERSAAGFTKYGCFTNRSDYDVSRWLRHLQEELMDATVYIEALLQNKPQVSQDVTPRGHRSEPE